MKHKGITLIELIVVIAIMSIFSLGVYNYMSVQANIYNKQKVEVQLQFDAKLAVTQIANDIKNARFTQYSIETNYNVKNDDGTQNTTEAYHQLTSDKFSSIFGTGTGRLDPTLYKPIVYIDRNDGTSYIYATKNTIPNVYQLVKIKLNSTKYTLGSSTKIYDYKDENYSNSNFFTSTQKSDCFSNLGNKPAGWSFGNVMFIYEEYGEYYLIYRDGSEYNLYNLIPEADSVSKISETVITDNLNHVDGVDDGITVSSVDLKSDGTMPNNADKSTFNIKVSLSKSGITRTFSTCASRGGYDGGDKDANKYN